jgi:ElaB/YqjD/DUF883 family membrane-anchored ribosome-binding protein
VAEATTQFEQESHTMRAEMADTRAGLADKIETLERDITATLQNATGAVSETIDNVKATVEETVHAVQGAVHGTVGAIGQAFDLSAHTRQHPWLMVGAAVLVGLAAGSLLNQLRR